jgi:hypothetical protein
LGASVIFLDLEKYIVNQIDVNAIYIFQPKIHLEALKPSFSHFANGKKRKLFLYLAQLLANAGNEMEIEFSKNCI